MPSDTQAVATPGLSAGVQSALHDLSSEEFATREKGLRDLQVALGQQVQAMLGSQDLETQAHVASLLEFNEGLSRWILGALNLPEERRRALLAFGLKPEVLPIVAKSASLTPSLRVEAVRALAHLKDPIANEILAPLLDDDDRAVSVAAMEAAWDREPNDAIIDRLWDRAVEAGFAIYNPPGETQPEIFFRGQALGPTFYDNSAYRKMQDADIACEVLVHLKSPQVGAKLTAFFEKVNRAINQATPRDNRIWMYGATSAPMKNVYTLLTAYHPKEALPVLFQLATGQMRQPFNGQINNRHYFWSNRTLPFATLLLLTDQDPGDYKLSQVNPPVGTWAFLTQADEEAGIKKLRAWWTVREGTGQGDKVTR